MARTPLTLIKRDFTSDSGPVLWSLIQGEQIECQVNLEFIEDVSLCSFEAVIIEPTDLVEITLDLRIPESGKTIYIRFPGNLSTDWSQQPTIDSNINGYFELRVSENSGAFRKTWKYLRGLVEILYSLTIHNDGYVYKRYFIKSSINTHISKLTDISWDLRSVMRSYDMSWTVLNATAAEIHPYLNWAIVAPISVIYPVSWEIPEVYNIPHSISWSNDIAVETVMNISSSIEASLTITTDILWELIDVVVLVHDVSWDIEDSVSTTINIKWYVLEYSPLLSDIAWSITAAETTVQDIECSITAEETLTHDISWSLTVEESLTYDVSNSITSPVSEVYDISWSI